MKYKQTDKKRDRERGVGVQKDEMEVLVVLVRIEVVQELVESTELMEGAAERLYEYACTQ